MPYTVSIAPFDIGGFFATVPPTLSGRFDSPPGTTVDRVGPATGLAPLTFPLLASPPTGAGTMHIVDTATSGDLYRSGIQATWPAPATLTLYTLPPSGNTALPGVRTTFTNAELLALAAPLVGTVIPVPGWVTALGGAATGFMFVPLSLIIGAVSAGTAPLTFNITGTLTFRQLFFNRTSRFTATVGISLAPSGDARDLRRILAVGITTALLDPGFITPLISLTIASLTPLIAQAFTSLLDTTINRAIRDTVDTALSGAAPPQELSPTASICARRVTATTSGVSVQAVLSDLFGEPRVNKPVHPAVPVRAEALNISITPQPRAGVMQQYAVTVRNTAGNAVAGASVRLTNHDTRGATITTSAVTDAAGKAVFSVELRGRLQRRVVIGPSGRETVMQFHPPQLRAEKSGFAPAELALLSAP